MNTTDADCLSSLPSIVEKVRLKAVEIDAKLSKIPEPVVGNIPLKILEKVLEFEREVQLQIDGGSAIHPFRKLWKNYANEFIHLLKKSRPRLVMQECISLDSEDEAVHAPSTGKRQREAEVEQVSCKRSASAVRDTPEKEPSWEIPVLTNLPPINGRKFTLLEIRNIRQDAYVGLPCGVHPKATERMIEMSLESWEKPLNGFLRKTTVLCQRMADRQINETFGDWQRTPLFNQINEISESFMKTLFIDLGQTAKRLYSLEISRPVAFNSESLNICVKKSLNELQDSRREWLAWKLVEKEEARNPRLKSSPHKEEKVAKMSEAQIGPDPCSKEIELMGVGTLCGAILSKH